MFKEYKGLDLVNISAEVLESWKKNNIFRKSLQMREGAPKFIFFEGPPSANGMPGIHHVMARSIKDVICRYKTQKGYLVERKAGWDTHGLPVELGVEKMLGITKEDIGKKISVDEYNSACRKEVMKYTKEWVALTERIGYWVDMDNPYITYDNKYIETLWHLLKDIYGKDAAFRDDQDKAIVLSLFKHLMNYDPLVDVFYDRNLFWEDDFYQIAQHNYNILKGLDDTFSVASQFPLIYDERNEVEVEACKFASELLKNTILSFEENTEIIKQNLKEWEYDGEVIFINDDADVIINDGTITYTTTFFIKMLKEGKAAQQ